MTRAYRHPWVDEALKNPDAETPGLSGRDGANVLSQRPTISAIALICAPRVLAQASRSRIYLPRTRSDATPGTAGHSAGTSRASGIVALTQDIKDRPKRTGAIVAFGDIS